MIEKIVSGGQTGADRGGLDAAIELGIPHGGWCPLGRLAEDGPIPEKYQLQETDSDNYLVRTKKNVEDSDGTMLFMQLPVFSQLSGGTKRTQDFVYELGKPCWILNFEMVNKQSADFILEDAREWINKNGIKVVNIAGQRASKAPQIELRVKKFLKHLLGKEAS